MKQEETFKVGDRVRVRGHREIACIEVMLTDIEGGVMLDRYVDQFRYWNVKDLVRAPEQKKS